MVELVGPELREVPYYGMMDAEISGAPVVISQTGFSGEEGYEVYVRDATLNAEAGLVRPARHGRGLWPSGHRARASPTHRRRHPLMGPGHGLRDLAVPGQSRHTRCRERRRPTTSAAPNSNGSAISSTPGDSPFRLKLVGLRVGGLPVTDYAPDFWLVQDSEGHRSGYVTSIWWSPELATNIALAHVPWEMREVRPRG